MNVKISVFVICVDEIIYLLLFNLHDCTFKKEYHKVIQMDLYYNFNSFMTKVFII